MSIWRQLLEITKLLPGYTKDLVIRFLEGAPRSNVEATEPVRPDKEPDAE